MSKKQHICAPGDGCPRSVQGRDGHQFRIAASGGAWTVHDTTGEWARYVDKGSALNKRANPPLVGEWPTYTEAVAAVCS